MENKRGGTMSSKISETMDYISLPFSFEQISELLDLCPTDDDHPQQDPPLQQKKNNVQPMAHVIPFCPITSDNKPSKDEKKLKSSSSNALKNLEDVNEIKKIMHRDVERRRRQEMTTLYRTLRSELPIECLKGKRSAADHIHETVGYITVMQRRIEKLNEKKDKLMSKSSATSLSECSKSYTNNKISVQVKSSMSGIKVYISTDVSGGLNLSGVLSIVSGEEGLSVANCISARVHSRMLHTLDIEINNGQKARAVELQRKIIDFCNRNMSKEAK